MVALNKGSSIGEDGALVGHPGMGFHAHEYADNGSTFDNAEQFPKVR
jgi:hypothetical protein